MYIIVMILKFVIIIIFMLLSVALYTLLERKVLGYIQIRKGPNKVGFIGLFQPFSDGLKLFIKEDLIPNYTNKIVYFMSPIYGLMMSFLLIILFPFMGMGNVYKWSILLFLSISSISVYSVIMSGWSSLSKYSNLGSYRSVAQTISYEVSLSFVLLAIVLYYESFSFLNWFGLFNKWFIILYILLFMLWMVIIIAETNRSPFDLSESESELVSGFNTEYSGGGFALIFISEYSNIIMMCIITVILFMQSYMIFSMVLMMMFLWVRGSFPRIRYDYLMYMSWKMFLPVVLGIFFFMVMNYFLGL